MNPTLIKNYTAGGAIAAYRIVMPGAADGVVVQATAATDSLMGVCGMNGPLSGERVDVRKAGITLVEFGGAVARGAPVTSDANGKAVAAAPAAGANARIIGFAEVSAVSGDLAPILLAQGLMQG